MRRSEASPIRCLYVTQWYTPERGEVAPQIARALHQDGLAVSVLTGVPHYPTGVVMRGYRATRPSTESIDGIRVCRTPEYPSHSRSVLERSLTYLSWATSASIFGLREFRWADVAVVYSSPATAAIPAVVGRLVYGIPYVLVVQDLWPDSILASGFDRPLLRAASGLLRAMCALFYKMSAHICVISPGMADVLVSRGVPREKITLVYNWVDSADEPTTAANLAGGAATGTKQLLYAGNHGPAQALGPIIERVAGRGELVFNLFGGGIAKAELQRLAEDLAATNIIFNDPVAPDVLSQHVRETDVMVVSLDNAPLFRVTMPSKMQAVLAAGKPVLAVASGDIARVVKEAECGWVAEPGDGMSIEAALEAISLAADRDLARLGANGRAYFDAHMSRERNAPKLRRIVRDVAATRRGRKGP